MRVLLCALIAMLLASQQPPWTMARLPGTGQTARFTTTFGQDGDYALNPSSLATNGDGTVTDMVTGLVWQQSDGGEMTWEAAGAYCKDLALGGWRDWRLPFAREAFSILNHSTVNPALDTRVFTRTAAEYWWAAESRPDDATRIWVTNAGGGAGPHPKNETSSAGGGKKFHARCVRSPIRVDRARHSFTDNGDGTVTDDHTGLMWQKADSGTALSWEEALRYSEGLTLAGRDDWRLPNIKELQSINDESLTNPSLDRSYFGGALPAEYWSSTTQVNQPTLAWTLDFALGIVSYRTKAEALRVRAVRGGYAGVAVTSAASFASDAVVAPTSLASGFGNLAADVSLTLIDGAATVHNVTTLAVAPSQVNFIVPAAAEAGLARLAVAAGGKQIAAGVLKVEPVAPGLFAANADGKGVAAALALTVDAGGRQTTQFVFDPSADAGARRGVPIAVGRAGEQVFLLLFGTGMRYAAGKVQATVGGLEVAVMGPAAQGEYPGLDQVNLGPLGAGLAGRGEVEIVLSLAGKIANKVAVNIQ